VDRTGSPRRSGWLPLGWQIAAFAFCGCLGIPQAVVRANSLEGGGFASSLAYGHLKTVLVLVLPFLVGVVVGRPWILFSALTPVITAQVFVWLGHHGASAESEISPMTEAWWWGILLVLSMTVGLAIGVLVRFAIWRRSRQVGPT
jgi:hypothetical protein